MRNFTKHCKGICHGFVHNNCTHGTPMAPFGAPMAPPWRAHGAPWRAHGALGAPMAPLDPGNSENPLSEFWWSYPKSYV